MSQFNTQIHVLSHNMNDLLIRFNLYQYTYLQLILSFTLITVLSYILLRLLSLYAISTKLNIQLRAIPTPPTRYPFSHFVDLVSSNPWLVLFQWMKQLNSRMIRFQFGSYTYIVVSDPKVIEHVMKQTKSNDKGDFLYQKDLAAMSSFLPILGNGLVTSRGVEWHKQSSLIAPVLRSDILQDTARNSIEATDRLIYKLLDSSNKYHNDSSAHTIGICDEFRHLTLQVIGKSILSLSAIECSSTFPDLYLPIADECNTRVYFPIKKYLPLYSNYKYNSALNQLNNYISEKITTRYNELYTLGSEHINKLIQQLNNSESCTIDRRSVDILDRILLSMISSGESWSSNNIAALRDQIKTFVLAGHETTSMMLTWSLYELMLNPQCMQKCIDSAHELWGNLRIHNGEITSDKQPVFDDMIKSDYTTAVLRESLRKWSVVPLVVREAMRDDTLPHVDGIGAVNIPKGTNIAINVYAVHHQNDDSETYGWSNPSQFIPERFMGDNKNQHFSHRFMAFIQGPRKCIGQHFALLEAKIVLSRLVLLFDMKPSEREHGKYHQFNIPITPDQRMDIHYKLKQPDTKTVQ